MNTNGLTTAQVATLRLSLANMRDHALANYSDLGIIDSDYWRGQRWAYDSAIELLDAACAAPATVDELTLERAVEVLSYYNHRGTSWRIDTDIRRYRTAVPVRDYLSLEFFHADEAAAIAKQYLRADVMRTAPTDGETASPEVESDKDYADRTHRPVDALSIECAWDGQPTTAGEFYCSAHGGLEWPHPTTECREQHPHQVSGLPF